MFPGFNRRKKGSISNGDWDKDGVSNRKDCEPLNYKRQDGGQIWEEVDDEVMRDNIKAMRSYAPGERDLIKERLEFHRKKKKQQEGGNR